MGKKELTHCLTKLYDVTFINTQSILFEEIVLQAGFGVYISFYVNRITLAPTAIELILILKINLVDKWIV